MKILGIIGAALGVIAILFAFYYIGVIVPAANDADVAIEAFIANSSYSAESNPYDSPIYRELWTKRDMKVDYGEYLMLTGILAFLLSIVPAFKKRKIAWIGVGLGLVSLFIGAAYGTHMLS